MCRAVRRIQKIIHVTKPTETIDSVPPKISRDGPVCRMLLDV